MSAPDPLRSDHGSQTKAAAPRFAVYFAPDPDGFLHWSGSSWLGRDAFGNTVSVPDFASRIESFTQEPRRYGFHATLKAPMALRDHLSADDLIAELTRLAQGWVPFEIELRLARIDGFLALVPASPSTELDALAAHCVETLDGFRKPASDAELERRRKAGLSARQESNLVTWGYPYVFEDFAFHMTLTRRLSEQEAQDVAPLAKTHFAPVLGTPVAIDALTLFVEPRPGADFTVLHRAPLGKASKRAAP